MSYNKMTVVRIQKIIWGKGIPEHISKHAVTTDETEIVIRSDALILEGHSKRKILVNRLASRIISVIVEIKGNKLKVFTARDASQIERNKFYEYEKIKNHT